MPSQSKRQKRPLTKKRQAKYEATDALKAQVYLAVKPMAESLPPFSGEYTDELGRVMADMVAEGTMMDELVTLPNMPPMRILLRWIRDTTHPFHKLYYEAKDMQVALYEERVMTTSTKANVLKLKTTRQVLDRDGNVVDVVDVREEDNVRRSELAAKAYQWSLTWLRPRKHGRLATPDGDKPNDQLKNLFDALMAGPAKEEDEPAD